ncbi:MAG: ABC transporter permease [Agathobaculum sp.]|nr:ABC transporter permease [Agathobaculum sp.]MCI7125412.1 ABC transporter permease [Agathobaculum sp.]MCI7356660.1 ABC transporter permease [Parabacteroides sp.]MDY3711840.1 ABC transporter permease [Agathobaculum sp.]
MLSIVQKLKKNQFLFQQLVHRDFTKKYKRTVLGIAWSVLSPLLSLFVMNLVFSTLLGSEIEHYTIYLFSGQLIFSFFSDSTNQGMTSLLNNAEIFTKVNVPKYMFLFSQNVSSLINFGITLLVYFVFVLADGIVPTWKFLLLIYPVVCLVVFNLGMGLILSALYMFFRDIQYLYSIFTLLLMYMSAIFYSIEAFPQIGQNLFLLNPVYVYIRYFRKIVIDNTIPTVQFHLVAIGYALIAFGIGAWIYKKKNHSFLYYV